MQKQAGLNEVPVMIRKYNENEIVEIALIENIQRDNLNPIEEAMAYKRLMEEFELKQDEVATKVSKSRASITNSLRLLKLDPRVQKMLEEEMISTGHARALLAISNKAKHYDFCVSRAVANLSTLCEYCMPYVKVGGRFVSYKSEKITEEAEKAKHAISVLGGKFERQVEFTLPDSDIYRNIYIIQKEKITPKKYPRKAGLPSKEPL